MSQVVVGLGGLGFMVALIRTLAALKPHAADLPAVGFLLTPRASFGLLAAGLLLAVGALLILGLVIGPAFSLMSVSALIALGITVAWRRDLTPRVVAVSVLAGLITGGGIVFLGNGDFSWAIFNLMIVPLLLAGGALLLARSGLARSRVLEGDFVFGARSFLWGCVLALPAALFNLLGNIQASDTWLIHGWQSLYAVVPAIAEETWARLFLTTFCYALLRPATAAHPRRAVVVAILVGALVHAVAHSGLNPIGLVIGSLLYGVPTALLFIKHDFEQAVGYHFLIDLVRFGAALLRA
jgi:hypothetical protein